MADSDEVEQTNDDAGVELIEYKTGWRRRVRVLKDDAKKDQEILTDLKKQAHDSMLGD